MARRVCKVPEINTLYLYNSITENIKKILWDKYYMDGQQQQLL